MPRNKETDVPISCWVSQEEREQLGKIQAQRPRGVFTLEHLVLEAFRAGFEVMLEKENID